MNTPIDPVGGFPAADTQRPWGLTHNPRQDAGRMRLPSRASAVKIALVYALAGAVWILWSDWLLHKSIGSGLLHEQVSVFKGWLYVLVTALLLGVALDRYFLLIRRSAVRLHASEERWKRALEGASQAVWDWNVVSGEVHYSPEWKAMLGYAPEEVRDELDEWRKRVHPEDLERVMREVARHLDGETEGYASEHRMLCKDGHHKWILDQGRVTDRGPNGRALRMVGTHADIDRRKRAEAALAESEARFRGLFDHCPDGALVVDAETQQVVSANAAMCQLLGYGMEELLQLAVPEIHPAEALERVRSEFTQLSLGQNHFVASMPVLKKDRSVFLADISASRLKVGNRSCMVGWFRDTTERARSTERSRIKHDLMQALASTHRLEDGLKQCLDAAIRVAGMDSGGIYLVRHDGGLALQLHHGLSAAFAREVSQFGPATPQASTVAAGKLVCVEAAGVGLGMPQLELREGLRCLAVAPILHEGRPVGCLNVASHTRNQLEPEDCRSLETIAAGAAQAIARLRAEQALAESRQRLVEAQHIAQVGSWSLDLASHRLEWSEETHRIFETSATDFSASFEAFMAVVHPEDRDMVDRAYRGSLEQRAPCEVEHRLLLPGGRVKVVHARWRTECEASGRAVRSVGSVQDVTERRRAEQALQHQEARLRLALEAAGMVTWELNAETRRLEYSANLSTMAGAEDTSRCTTLEVFIEQLHPDDRPATEAAIQRTLREGTVFDCEYRVRLPDGSWHWLAGRGKALSAMADGVRRVLGVTQDVTERRRLEKEREEALVKYRTLFDSLPLGVTVADREGRIIETNRVAEDLLGVSGEEQVKRRIGGHEWHMVRTDGSWMPPEEYASVRALAEQRLIRDVEMGLVKECGATTWLAVTAAPVPLAEVGVVITYSDIGARKRAEQALRESEAKYRIVADNTFDWEFWLSSAGFFVYNSPSCERLTGYSAEAFGRDADLMRRLVHPEDLTRYETHHRHSVQGQVEPEMEFRIVRADGEIRWIGHVCAPIWDERGRFLGVRGSNRDITERKQAEGALRYRENLLRQMGRVAKVGGWEFEVATGAGHWTEQVARIHDLDPAGSTCLELGLSFYQGDSRVRIERAIARCVEHQEPYDLELELVTGQGARKWVRTIGEPVVEGGRVVRVRGAFQDVTDHQLARQALEVEAVRRRMLIEGSRDGIVVLDRQGKVVEANRRFSEMLGYSAEELQELHVWDWDRGWPPDRVLEAIRELGPEGAHFETCHSRKDGTSFDVELSNSAAEIGGQKLVLCVCHDITERKRAAEALEVQRRFLLELIENSSLQIYVKDRDGRYQLVNRAFEKATAFPRERVLGRTDRELFGGADAEQFRRDDLSVMESGASQVFEETVQNPDGGMRALISTKFPTRDGGGRITGLCGMSLDATEKRRLESQLRQAQKLEAVGQLAGGVAHDFNNILAAILMHLGMLQAHPALDAETLLALKELEAEAQRAATLTRQLLMFSRRSVLEVRRLFVNDVVANLLKMLTRLIGEHVTLRFDGGTRVPQVEADAGMLEQVLMNLVVNARDAMPMGGRITISTSCVEVRAADTVIHPERRDGRFVCLGVSDTGTGMEHAVLKRIFEPFFTTKEAGKGTGLGLATVHGIVAQHKGWVEVESAVGEGTTFSVFLPALAEDVSEAAEAEALVPVRAGKETLLVVEDAAKLRQVVCRTLRGLGYQVFEAENGQEAMRVWQQHKSQIDLLLTDMVMPEGMTGLELAERLRSAKPGLKVIITSGYSAEIVQAGVPHKAGLTYLPKPYGNRKLSEAIRACLDQES